ncbi:TPA: relaxase domain-containing protein [Burkholderia vietnamiensis]|nr:relaxase domain-containing protein [Burkholderia vietnamiensis]
MMTFHPLTPKGQNKGGMSATAYFQAGEYHREALTGRMYAPTAWHGKAAEKLGLSGNVDFTAFEKLLDGFDPTTGMALNKNAGADNRRPGWDLTFSMEKSMSVVMEDPQTPAEVKAILLAIHNEAVQASLNHLESLVEVKTGAGGHERRPVEGLVFSTINHHVSRAGDPAGHTHCVLHNVGYTTDPDGTVRWNTIDPGVIKEHERGLGAFYRSVVQWKLQQHTDLKVERVRELDAEGYETGEVYWRIAGVGDFPRDHFSKRTDEIKDYMLEHAGVGRQGANLATRADKDELAYPEQEKKWAVEYGELRERSPELMYNYSDLRNAQSNLMVQENKPRSDEEILDACLKMNSFFTHGELLRQVSQEWGGHKSPDQILAHTNRIMQSPEIMYYGRDKDHLHQYSTQKMRDVEADIKRRALARQNDPSVAVSESHIDSAMERFEKENGWRPSAEQIAGARHLCSGKGTVVLSGYAGAGKTSGMYLSKLAMEEAGKTLLGVSTAWDASNKLAQDVGIKCVSSMAMLVDLKNGKLSLNKNHVVVFDEGGMAGLHLAEIQKYVDDASAKLVILGDNRQLIPVTASNPMRLITDAIGDAKLTEIRRQKAEKNRGIARTWYGMDNPDGKPDGKQILEAMMANNHIKTAETDRDAMRQLVEAYFKDERTFEQKLVLGGTRAEVAGLNEAIRAGYKESGTFEGEDHTVRAIVNGQYRDIPIAVNERIRFSRRNDDLQVVNGDGGIVTGIKPNEDGTGHIINVRLVSEIEDRNGRELVVDTTKFKSFAHSYALTTHKSQGSGRSAVYAYVGERGAMMINNNMAMVSYTRHQDEYTMFVAESVLHGTVDEHGTRHGGLVKRFEDINVKLTTQDLAVVAEKPVYMDVLPPPKQSITDVLAQQKQAAIEQAREIEKQSAAQRAAAIVAMDRALQSEIGERDAVKAQVSAFMKNLPAIIERQEREQRPTDENMIKKYMQDLNEWYDKLDAIDRERGGAVISESALQPDNGPKVLIRQGDPKDPPRPQYGKDVNAPAPTAAVESTVVAEPTTGVTTTLAPVAQEQNAGQRPAPAPAQPADEGQIRQNMREMNEWQAKIDAIDRQRGGAVFSDGQDPNDTARIQRVPDPRDPPRPEMPDFVAPVRKVVVRRRPTLTVPENAQAVFDLPQAVGTEVLERPVRKLDVTATLPGAMKKPEVKQEVKLEPPKLEQKDDTQRPKQETTGPKLRRPRQQL